MDEIENIKNILYSRFPYINGFFAEMINAKLNMPNYEEGLITSQLLKAANKASLSEKENDDNDDDEYYGFDGEYYESDSYKLDVGLHLLDRNLYFGQRNCDGFDLIFPTISVYERQQDVDDKITEILAHVKCCDFLSRAGLTSITKLDQWKNKLQIDFKARKLNDYYAVVVTYLYSAKYIEEHFEEYDEPNLMKKLSNDISYAINQKYPQVEQFCRTHAGVNKGIVFISSGNDYFGSKKYKNQLYGLKNIKVLSTLNKEWQLRKKDQKNYKYLSNIVITSGKNTIVYPSLK
jgi:hypothetical protein